MRLRGLTRQKRRGAAMYEGAMVISITTLLLAGSVIAGLGVYRYQQVAFLARSAARYASVHGGQFAEDTGNPMATSDSIYNQVIKPGAIGLDLNQLKYTVAWDNANEMPLYMANPATNQYLRNRVTVTISYTWVPEAFLSGMTLSSTSVMEVSY